MRRAEHEREGDCCEFAHFKIRVCRNFFRRTPLRFPSDSRGFPKSKVRFCRRLSRKFERFREASRIDHDDFFDELPHARRLRRKRRGVAVAPHVVVFRRLSDCEPADFTRGAPYRLRKRRVEPPPAVGRFFEREDSALVADCKRLERREHAPAHPAACVRRKRAFADDGFGQNRDVFALRHSHEHRFGRGGERARRKHYHCRKFFHSILKIVSARMFVEDIVYRAKILPLSPDFSAIAAAETQ